VKKTCNYNAIEIKEALIASCVEYKPKDFIPFLLSKNVITEFPNKIRCYRFLKKLVNCAKINSVGPLRPKIEQKEWLEDKDLYTINFYDSVHRYTRISIEWKESSGTIFINPMPF
jgi:hypothetical protein